MALENCQHGNSFKSKGCEGVNTDMDRPLAELKLGGFKTTNLILPQFLPAHLLCQDTGA